MIPIKKVNTLFNSIIIVLKQSYFLISCFKFQLKNQNLDNISGKSLIVTQDDLLKALEETKPSMTEKEKEKYRRM